MQLLGSSIYVTSYFLYICFRGVYLVHWTHSFLYLHINAGSPAFQDGMFHKKMRETSDKMRMDK